jgi:hypothetical protein
MSSVKKVLVTVSVVGLLGGGLFWVLKRQGVVDPAQEALNRSIRMLRNPEGNDPGSLYRSILTVGSSARQDDAKVTLSLAKHEQPLVRAGVAYTSGRQDGKDFREVFESLKSDPHPLVRSHVIHAMREKPGEDQVAWLKKALEIKDLPVPERMEALAALHQSQKGKDGDRETKEEMMEIAQKELSRKNASPLVELNRMFGSDERVRGMNRKVITGEFDAMAKQLALRALFQERDPAVVREISKWIHHEDAGLRRVAVEYLPKVCPHERWKWIEEGIGKEPDFAGRSVWLLATEQIGGKKALETVQRILEQTVKSGVSQEVKAVEQVLERIKHRDSPDLCSGLN